MDIKDRALKYEDYIINMRRWFHQHPELSNKEFETTERIIRELGDIGIEARRFDGLTGCQAVIRGGKVSENPPTILLRADIDALPTQEATDLPYKSVNDGVMHSCGHDSHIAMLLGAARILTDLKGEFSGNVKLIFQGAEETAIGAKAYVDRGVLNGVDAVLGLHIASWKEAGYFSIPDGPQTASSDQFTITVKGKACHGGLPHEGHDSITAAAAIVMNLQTLISRENDPRNASVITIGRIDGGYQYNIVAGKTVLYGNVRDFSKNHRMEVSDRIREMVQYTAKAYGCSADIDYEFKTGPVIHEDVDFNNLVRNAATKLFGADVIKNDPPVSGSDDFAYFCQDIPGVFAFLGGRNEAKGCAYPHHHECFNVDESAFVKGSALLAQASVDFLNA